MAKELLGKEVTAALKQQLLQRVAALSEKDITPKLAVVRCGEQAADISYENGAVKCADSVGVAVEKIVLPRDVTQQDLIAQLQALNEDKNIHGVLMLRPLPEHLRQAEQKICNTLCPEKDVDGMTDLSSAGVFLHRELGFPPCTAQACMEVLSAYGIDCTGKHAVVIGRSAVVGKPAAMMLLQRNATVTVCHTKTKNLPELTRQADIIVTSAGVLNSLTAEMVRAGQVVLDVSINWDADKKEGKGGIAGDADYAAVAPIVDAITPVPGGIGAVTTVVLMEHVVRSAERMA